MKNKIQEQKFYYEKNEYLAYTKNGIGDLSLVFLHGFGASKTTWDELYPLFDSNVFKSYLIDFKGFGGSSIPKDDNYSLENNVSLIDAFIKANIHGKYILIGHSYGAAVALVFAVLNQSNTALQSIILIDCPAYDTDIPFFITYLNTPIFNKIMYFFSTPKIRAEFSLRKIVAKENYKKKIIDRYIESYEGLGKEYSFIKTANQIAPKNYNELIGSYEEIKIPTLIIWGKEDKVLPIKQGERLSKQIKNSKLDIIEGSGHIPQEEKPYETYQKIISFIKKLLP